jgi:starvation-inducible DNA-binding protein
MMARRTPLVPNRKIDKYAAKYKKPAIVAEVSVTKVPAPDTMDNMDMSHMHHMSGSDMGAPDTNETEGPQHEAAPGDTQEDVQNQEPGDLCNCLQGLLDTVFDFYTTTHQFHWNLVDPDFSEYHEFFEEIYEDVHGSVDPLGESIRKLDDMVALHPSTPPTANSLGQMLHELMTRNDGIINQYKDAIDEAEKEREQGILNFLADRLDMHQKWRWQIKSSMR